VHFILVSQRLGYRWAPEPARLGPSADLKEPGIPERPSVTVGTLLEALGSDGYLLPGTGSVDVLADELALVGVCDPEPSSTACAMLTASGPQPQCAALVVRASEAEAVRDWVKPGSPVLVLSDAVRWQDALERLTQCFPEGDGLRNGQELFDLADALARSIGGAVSIEDPEARVLAYSTIPGQPIDEIRREGILGRQVPEHEKRTDWYRRLWDSDGVIELFADGAGGGTTRTATALKAGTERIGSIWVMGSLADLLPGSKQALEHARQPIATAVLQSRQASLRGRSQRAVLLERVLRGDRRPRVLSASSFVLVHVVPLASGHDVDMQAMRLADVLALRAVRDGADGLAGFVDGQVWAVLPSGTPARLQRDLEGLLAQAGLTSARVTVSGRLDDVAELARTRELLALLGRLRLDGADGIRFADAFADTLALAQIGEAAAGLSGVSGGAAARMIEHDREHGTEYARSMSTWLRTGGDYPATAAVLHLHPNSLRYRHRRAVNLFDLDLDDPDARLLLHLQLRLAEIMPLDDEK
jgi:hypothetical protein